MANNEEGEETAPHKNEWEEVLLTQSVYDAAPGPKEVDLVDDSSAGYVAETSDPMLMSRHFVVPPNQPENLPSQPNDNEILNDQGTEDATPEFVADKGSKSDVHENSTKTKGLSPAEYPGFETFDEKCSTLSKSGAEFEEDAVFQGLSLVDKEQNFFGDATYSSFHCEEPIGVSASTEESNMLGEPVEPFHEGIDSGMSNSPKAKDEANYDSENLPCQAWWKRRAVSLIAHAKDANGFWSIFIAAAVMGLVIIGQRWKLDRWEVSRIKLHFGGHPERMGRTISPISRLKDVMIGSDRRGSFIRGSASALR